MRKLEDPAEAAADDDFEAYLRAQQAEGLLRVVVCGDAENGEATLRALLSGDAGTMRADRPAATAGGGTPAAPGSAANDVALLVDRLRAERDIGYRVFATGKRTLLVSDAVGREPDARNTVRGASAADLAVILADSRRGITGRTRRDSYIAAVFGVRHAVLAVDAMDRVEYDRVAFERIAAEYREFAGRIGIDAVTAIPLSALQGDNVLVSSDVMPWYEGPALLPFLETAEAGRDLAGAPFRMPVQRVDRSGPDHPALSGTIASGRLRPGDAVVVQPANRTSRVDRIAGGGGDLDEAVAGQTVTVTLRDGIDVARGDLLATAAAPAEVTDQFQAQLVWISDHPLIPERQYLLKIGSQTVGAAITELRYRVNVDTLEHLAAKTLAANEVAVCNLALDRPVAYDPHAGNRTTGGFTLIDRFTDETAGVGTVIFGLRRATNLTWHDLSVDRAARAALKGQKPCILWFTGLSGSGKSTVADLVEKRLHSMGRHTYLLDGDNVRHGLNKDLGFTEADRVENNRRVAETAKLFADAGMIVLVSFISPFRNERLAARELVDEGEFIEIFVDSSIEVCERRDPKGLYAKARQGAIKNFTGIDSPYEPPEHPEIHLRNDAMPAEDGAERIVAFLLERGFV